MKLRNMIEADELVIGYRVINRRHPLRGHGKIAHWSDQSPFRVRVQYDDGRGEWLHIDDLMPEDTTCGVSALS